MPQRLRKFIGAVLMLILVVVWALGAMTIAQGRVTELHWALQTVCYVLLGTLWVIPAGALIWWMEQPDRRA
ncbi:DUF2842 domain-containing protein [Xanthobacter tagetidis]|jgi:predicted membrane channel-forming protein YqfA (hemolysin III family)|uniref:DUF2842 domain-containing protein n=1 Tax=Xanthobacter tagetidis TaxID=60216 RepID=A0A3L7AF20_9HYPH|nr:DUF2842 domain-containing protein [Xanthobacter tagetidis]MBB6309750.1 putative membrane channel-forming protein YqfA (hemolysin III family) [Xanthobacter tagetidis]RLP78221.1 DUF2842 domain-containing protein [Xanthobacter tagetidis]